MLRAVLSGAVALAVGGTSFGILWAAELSHRSGGPVPGGGSPLASSTPGASPTGTPAATPAVSGCSVPAVEYGRTPGVGGNSVEHGEIVAGGAPSSVTAGFLDCATGKFRVDPTAPRLGEGDHDLVYIPGAGWKETATLLAGCGQAEPVDCGWSPDGKAFAYADDACASCSPVAGRVHVVDASGDRVITPAGEMDRVLGWTAKGIVVARVPSAGTAAIGAAPYRLDGSGLPPTLSDYLVNPTTGQESRLTTGDYFAADGAALWGIQGLTTLVRYDLATGGTTDWPLPANQAGEGVVVPVGFDGAGDPVVMTPGPVSDLLVLTGPGTGTVVGPAQGGYQMSRASDDADAVVPGPGGGLVILELTQVTDTMATFDTLTWSVARGLHDLGASFTLPMTTLPGSSPSMTGLLNLAFSEPWPSFAGAVLGS